MRPHNRFLLSVFPPSNLYAPLVEQIFSLSEKKDFPTLQLVHNYAGSYLVGIYIKNPPPFGEPIDSKAILCLTISNDRNVLLEKTFTRWADRFGGPGNKEAGVMLGSYEVPDNIPFKINTQAVISVISSDPSFEEKYGELTFFIKRISDE
jgi:hypothetical protein